MIPVLMLLACKLPPIPGGSDDSGGGYITEGSDPDPESAASEPTSATAWVFTDRVELKVQGGDRQLSLGWGVSFQTSGDLPYGSEDCSEGSHCHPATVGRPRT